MQAVQAPFGAVSVTGFIIGTAVAHRGISYARRLLGVLRHWRYHPSSRTIWHCVDKYSQGEGRVPALNGRFARFA